MRKSVRLADIAKRLGVSAVTVSNALTNQKGVSEELRGRIKETAAQMGYQASNPAPLLKTAVTFGIIVSEKYLDNHMTFYWKLYQELMGACQEQGTFLLLEILKPEAEQELQLPLIVREGQLDGMIVMGELSRAYLRRLEAVGLKLLFMDFYAGGFDVDCVTSDNFYGMHTMTRYLVKKGHRRIAYVGTVFSNSSVTDRYFGYLKAVRQYGLEERDDWVINDRDKETFALLDEIVLPQEMPGAFVCSCDLVASSLIRQLTAKGFRVPEDVSVAGYDNFLFSGLCEIGITTYEVNMPEMARAAAKRMLERVHGKAEGPGRLFIVGGTLIEKESVREKAKTAR